MCTGIRITHRDADCIVEFRDNKKLSWSEIGRRMGIGYANCKKHYYLRKEGYFYFHEFIEEIKKMEDLHLQSPSTLYPVAKAMGCKTSFRPFSTKLRKYNVMHKYSTKLKQKRVDEVMQLVKEGTSFLVAVDRLFVGYSVEQKLAIERELSK